MWDRWIGGLFIWLSSLVYATPSAQFTHSLYIRDQAINKYSTSATILCDSISAPKGIQNSATNLTYYHAYHIYTQSPSPSQANGIALYLQWIIGHCDNPRNDATRPAMSFPPTTHKGKGAHPRQHPRSVGTGVEIIHSK